MTKSLLLIAMLMIGGLCSHNSNGLRNYQCSKCATLVKSERTPSTLNCRADGSHQWHELVEVGQENYNCKKCGTLLENKRSPSTLGCPAKGSHQWNHLGHVSNTTYQCRYYPQKVCKNCLCKDIFFLKFHQIY